MSNFVVSARKYRPTRFDEVVGQQHVSQTLKNALQTDHLAHAFLFCGPRGVGKTTCARILAKVLNCENRTDDFEPCNSCGSCTSFNENASLNITELDAASNNSVDHIRTLIEQVRFQPQQGQYKVFIIDEVHMLSQAAFNAFLKTLEEPPPYAIFILATTEKHKIIPTILSRCQIFDFKRIQIADMVAHLQSICAQEKIEADADALHIIAQKADGALRDSLSIFDRITAFSGEQITYEAVIDNLNVLDYDYFFRAVDFILTEDRAGLLLLFDEVLNKGFDADLFMNGLSGHLRNLLVVKDPQTLQLLEAGDRLRERYHQQAALANSSLLLTALNLANDCDINYRMARNKRLLVELSLLKMVSIRRAREGHPLVAAAAEMSSETAKGTEKKTEVNTPEVAIDQPTNPVEVEVPLPTVKEVASGGAEAEASLELVLQKTAVPEVQKVASTDIVGSLMAEVQAEMKDQPQLPDQEADIEQEQLISVWHAYLAELGDSPQAILIKDAVFEAVGREVKVRVGSKRALAAIKEDLALVQHLRNQLQAPKMILQVEEDEQLRASRPQPKKRLTAKDKYLAMREENPAIEELRKRFDLRPEE
ncbi:MAG: DNA polymerase III subunit gamma/tau [Bacteroidota bacterium]